MKKQPTLFSRVKARQASALAYARKEVETKRKVLNDQFTVNMTRWSLNVAEVAMVQGLKINPDSIDLYAGYNSVTLYLTVNDLPSLKDPLFVDFLERLTDVWAGPRIEERDYCSESSETAYRDYTITWETEAYLGEDYTRTLYFRVAITAYIANEADRKCHVECVKETQEMVTKREFRIVCDE